MASKIKPTQTATTSAKRCPDCSATKPLTAFYKNKARSDGLQSVCKECSKSRTGAYFARNPMKNAEACARWAANNPDKVAEKETRRNAERAKRRCRLERAVRYFRSREGWEHTLFRVLSSEPRLSSYCYTSPTLEELYLKYTEDAWNA